jgi:hypothetical protein
VSRPVLCAWLAAACATWTPRQFDSSPGGGTYVPGVARVTLRDSTRLELRDVRVTTDSVVGFVRSYGQAIRTGVVTSSVASIHERQISATKTLVLLGALGAVAVGAYFAAFAAGTGPNY